MFALILTPLAAIAVAAIWGVRLHLRALEVAEQLRKQIERLTKEKELAESAGAAKDEFLTKISHEIRTPLNCIIAFAKLAKTNQLTSEQQRHLDTVLRSAEWLSKVAGHVLEFTRMRSSKVEVEMKEFSVQELVVSAARMIEPLASAKHLALTYNIDSHIPAMAIGDRERLRQVIVNLLENAVRFTSTGSVLLSVVMQEDSTDGVLLRFSVADTGIGIPPERQTLIFEPFEGSGAGLGLSISKDLVTLMGGTIDVQSQIGAGSTFRFTVPLQRVRIQRPLDEYPNGAARATSRCLSILLAEADTVSRRTNTKVLESAGHQVTPATSGQNAVEVFSSEIFDLVLLGADLTDMDAGEVARRMRQFEAGDGRTPVYLLAPQAQPHHRAIDGCLRNPIETGEVAAAVGPQAPAAAVAASGFAPYIACALR